jgi:hypothetical protein
MMPQLWEVKAGVRAEDYSDLTEKMRSVFLATVAWMRYHNIHPVVTDFLRDPQEDPDSPHSYGRAVDLRTHAMSKWQKTQIQAHLNLCYPRGDGKPTGWVHGEGDREHLHIQVQGGTF